jgi:hypothetical protein
MVDFADCHITIPKSLTPTFVKQFHEGTHSGKMILETTLAQHFYVPKLSSISKAMCERCSLCAKSKPWQGLRAPPQVQSVGRTPLENLIMDFTEMPQAQRCKYWPRDSGGVWMCPPGRKGAPTSAGVWSACAEGAAKPQSTGHSDNAIFTKLLAIHKICR